MGAPHFQEGACGSPPIWETPRPAFPQVSQIEGRWETFPMEPCTPGRGKRRGRAPDPGRRAPVEHWIFVKLGYRYSGEMAGINTIYNF